MESSKSYTIRTETGEIRLMSQEEVGLLVRSTMEKARAMAPSSPRSPKSPATKPQSPTSPYTSTSQRLSRSPRNGKKLRLSPRNAGAFFEKSSSSSVSPQRTPKVDIAEEDRAESTPMRVTSTEERFTAMVTEKNFTVHTEVAGKKNLSETEINDLVRNSIRRARQNAKGKSRQQLETSFQNAVMLNEVTSSPVKRFSWSSPEGSLDDDSNSGKPLAQAKVTNVPEEQHTYDPCEISSIDGGGTRMKKKQPNTKRAPTPTKSRGLQVETVVGDLPNDQQSTPIHANVTDVLSPQSIGSANKSFRSFFGDKKVKLTEKPADDKAEAEPIENVEPLGGQGSEQSRGEDTMRQCAPEDSMDEKSDLQIDPIAQRQLQTIPEFPQKFVPTTTQRFRTVSDRPLTPTIEKVDLPVKTLDVSSDAGEGLAEIAGKPTDVPILKPSVDSSSSTRSESSKKSRLDVVITSEDVDDMKKASGDGRVTGPTRLEFTPGERSDEDEQEVSNMADIVQLTMSRARKTAQDAQDSVCNVDPGDLVSQTSSQQNSALDAGNCAHDITSLHSEETKVASNTFREKLSAPDLENERAKRVGLAMPAMLEDTEDDSDPPSSPLKPIPVLTPKQESFSAPARSAIAFISSATKPNATLQSTEATPSRSTQPFDEEVTDVPKKGPETSEKRVFSMFGRIKSKATNEKDTKGTTPSGVSNKSGRGNRPLLSVKHCESSEEEFPVAKKVRETLSASLHSNRVGTVAHSASEDSNSQQQRGAGWRFRSRTNRKQRRVHSTTHSATSSLSVDTNTVITSELIAGLASRQGETISAEELNKLILTTKRGLSFDNDEKDPPLGSPQEEAGEYTQEDRDIVPSLYAQFCMDFLDFFKFFDIQKTCDEGEDHDDFHSMTGMDTPMEESDDFDPLQEVAEETTTCDTDNDGVNDNPRMTFSFSVAEETSSSDSSSTSSEEECSSAGDW